MRLRVLYITILALSFSWLFPLVTPATWSSSAYAAVVNDIAVEGNQRVETETIMSYVTFSKGSNVDADQIDEAVKALFQTGLFSDVQTYQRGTTLVIKVVENPMINEVNFEGNNKIDDKTLEKEVQAKQRMIYTRASVQGDTQRIIAVYQKAGYYNVRVAPKMIRLPENRVNIAFEITEGDKTVVKTIKFSGNHAFSDSSLRGVIGTAQNSWWNFLQRNNTYDPDRLEYDKELIRRFYLKNGYADIKVLSADAELADNGEYFDIRFVVEEGPRYTVADVAVNIGDTNLDPNDLRKVIKTGVGDRFDETKVDKTVENLTLEASRQGFVFAKVEPKVDRDPATGTLNINYTIAEGTRAYVERINIIGNTRTRDYVIRRELQLYEGDAFNRTLVERARRRLTALDFFEKIDFREEEGSAPDKLILTIEVVEKSTGSIKFSVGFSSYEKLIGTVELTERNLGGRGQNVRLNTTLSFKKQDVDFSFTEPYFMGKPIEAGFDLYATQTDREEYAEYRSRQIGFALRAGFKIDEYSSVEYKYSFTWRKVSHANKEKSAPAIIRDRGTSTKSSLSSVYTWDNLDDPSKPTTGFRGEVISETAGLGGSAKFGRLEAHGWYFKPFFDSKVILKVEGNAGHIRPWGGKKVPLQDRFYMGGETFRGFEEGGVGPRQVRNDAKKRHHNEAIGANSYAIGTIELNYPVPLIPEGWGITGTAFTDFGTVFGTQDKSEEPGEGECIGKYGLKCSVLTSSRFRASIGGGILWSSPFGPLRFEAAYPLVKAQYDKKEWFRFSMGTRF